MTQLLRLAAVAAIYCMLTTSPYAVAAQYMDNGDFIFDIREPDDMTLVARLSGLTIKRDIPPRVGIIECARWARQFSIRPFSAVHSATVPNRRGSRLDLHWECKQQPTVPFLLQTNGDDVRTERRSHSNLPIRQRHLKDNKR